MLYGAAEFSRDTDLAILSDPENLDRLQQALDELRAERIAVPPFARKYLDMGLAVHFRCHHPQASRMRIDIMSRMRGVDDFPALWARRTTLRAEGESLELLSLPDLVQAKKTQRDKDWPMLTRLLEANYFQFRLDPSPQQIEFWFREMRSPSLLVEIARRFPNDCDQQERHRPLLAMAKSGDEATLRAALVEEQEREKSLDREYWAPLRAELQRLRSARSQQER